MTNKYVTRDEFEKFVNEVQSTLENLQYSRDILDRPVEHLVGVRFNESSRLDTYFTYLLEHDIDTELVDARTLVIARSDFDSVEILIPGSYKLVPVVNGPVSRYSN